MSPMRFYFDGQPFVAGEGQTVAMALWKAGIRELRTSPREEPRGLFCGMGVCQECVVWIEGRRRESCTTVVGPDLRVSSHANEPV